MKKIFAALLSIGLITSTYAQDKQSLNLEYVRNFFADMDPCVEMLYCYDYSFDLLENELRIEMKLSNFLGQPRKKTLTETTVFFIPLPKIKKVHYWRYNSEF